jgi:hypothetical protein
MSDLFGSFFQASEEDTSAHLRTEKERQDKNVKSLTNNPFPITKQTKRAVLRNDTLLVFEENGIVHGAPVKGGIVVKKDTVVEIKKFGKHKEYNCEAVFGLVPVEYTFVENGRQVTKTLMLSVEEGIFPSDLSPAPGDPTYNPQQQTQQKPQKQSSLLRDQRRFAQVLEGRKPVTPNKSVFFVKSQRRATAGAHCARA